MVIMASAFLSSLRHCFLLCASCFLMMCLEAPLEAMAPKVRAEIEPSLPLIKGELQGTLSFYHSPSDRLESLEARMEHTTLPLVFLFSSPLSAEERTLYPESAATDLVSVYRFQIPLQEPGIYPLPSIAVKVGKQWIRSIPSNYQVMPGPILPFLQLQAFISPSLHLYPGQRARFVYRMTYNHSMELVVEELPLLKAKGFEKIGSEKIEEKTLPRATMQEITQQVRAIKPGIYHFEESRIAGRRTHEAGVGDKTLLHDVVPPITVQVLPFPKLHQPFFFHGALAPIAIQTRLMSQNTIRIGDPCKLAVLLSSNEETLETFSPPDLNCQVGFNGFFQIDPEIQVEPIDAKTRSYLYYLYPLSYHISAIPSIEVAAFNPQKGTYEHARSEPIPLHIHLPEEIGTREMALSLPTFKSQGGWRTQLDTFYTPIQTSLLLPLEETHTWTIRLQPLLLYAFFLSIALFLQAWIYPKWVKKRMLHAPPISLQLMQSDNWQAALLHKLYEEKWITSPHIAPEALSQKGIVGEIRNFLVRLEAMHFAAFAPVIDKNTLKAEAQQLYAHIGRRA